PEGATVSGNAARMATPGSDEHQLVRGLPGCSAPALRPSHPGRVLLPNYDPASSSSGCSKFPGGATVRASSTRMGTPGRDEHQLVRELPGCSAPALRHSGAPTRPGVRCYCRRVIRQLRCIRGLRGKSLSRVWAEISSTWYFSSSAGSSLKRRKLLEKYSTPPGARRAMAMSS